ncbi:MAG TPA: hypothetical protein VML35_06130 [Gaiellaceae bacterium]|nr:hypothetical protein [Gaiellaceae bacterium]
MRRFLVLAALTLLVPAASAPAKLAVNKPLLGIAGQPDRFKGQTGQDSQIRHAFLGWEQGRQWGSPFSQIFASLKPIPMIHIGTDRGRARVEAITPAQIAAGRGDGYLVALNEAIAAYGAQIYVRVMAEMNNPKNHYSPTRPNGTSKGASHSPAAYKQAFRRAYLILHGGNVDAKLRRLGMPPVGRALTQNRAPALTVIWNPIAGFDARSARPAQEFYPGDPYVDMVGNDIFASRVGSASHAANEALYRAHPRKPYSLPEWGLDRVDDPGFVRTICEFLKNRPRTKLAAYYEARPPSRYDLGPKPGSRAEYRRCITPLGATAARQRTLPAGPPTNAQLRLLPSPAEGDAPLAVTFQTHVNLPRPVVQWEIAFGDGKTRKGSGPPPRTVPYTYASDGIYTATLIVYLGPPFTGTAIRFLTQARVKVGEDSGELLRLIPDKTSGKAPLAVSFRTIANPPTPVVRWEFVPGDGTSRSGQGKPPRFLGHTYKAKGVYRAVLIVYLQPQFQGTLVRLLTYADIRVS